MFLPTTREELLSLGWESLDVILVTGDSYIDSPFIGVAVIGKVLLQAGYRVGIIAQPKISDGDDITRLGAPRLFWGVTGGSVDSMVANYTSTRKRRRSDDYTPGGINNLRPDRAVIAYSNLIRRYFKPAGIIVLGGIEASLRRIAHYDYWSDKIRSSILFDAKADYLLYGMAEKTVVDLANHISKNQEVTSLPGLCYISKEPREGFVELPSHEQVSLDKKSFIEMFHTFSKNSDPLNASGLYQKHGERFLVHNPPADYLSQSEMDAVYAIQYELDQHPFYAQKGDVKALETIRFAISTHRGCYGDCNFCSITVHEGRRVRWRSKESILSEAERISLHPAFKGYILDVGGPTANMYGFECTLKLKKGACQHQRCLFPEICPSAHPNHSAQIDLLKSMRKIKGIKKIFVASGIRYDLILADKLHGRAYLEELVEHHISGQMKVAPDHTEDHILTLMGKPGRESLLKFKKLYDQINLQKGKKQFLTYYLIAAYPGCSESDMQRMQGFVSEKLRIHPEQVQIFTPLPSTYASVMYYTEMDPFSHQPLSVEKEMGRKERQKNIIVGKPA
jgi:uncharacterized radical SAM protein YgiQ